MSQNGYLFDDVTVVFKNQYNGYYGIAIEVKGTNLGFEKTVSEYGASEIVETFKKSGQQIIPCPPPSEPPAEPCTVEVADYGLIFDWYANAFVQGIYGNGGQLTNRRSRPGLRPLKRLRPAEAGKNLKPETRNQEQPITSPSATSSPPAPKPASLSDKLRKPGCPYTSPPASVRPIRG